MDEFINIPEVNKEIDPKLKRAQSLVGTSANRPENDFYPSPAIAVESLLDHETFEGSILEPACGDGAICKVLTEYGYRDVIATDLIDRGYGTGGVDFLTSTTRAANIITNPPFNIAQQFIEKSLELTTGKVAMLVKLQFLEGQKRKTFFQNSPLARVYVFSKRIPFYRNGINTGGSGMIAFSWHVYEHGYEGEPVVRWL